jgi:hypothetical protein
VRVISGLIGKPLRASAMIVGGVLRAEAAALSEIGKLAESVGELIRRRLEDQPDDAIPGPLVSAPPSPSEAERTSGAASTEQAPPSSHRTRPTSTRAVSHSPSQSTDVASPQLPPRDAPPTVTATPPRAPERPPAPPKQAPAPALTDAHVDEEAVLVAESADRGAEDGAGAAVRVQEPWPGYRAMRAREIIDRLPAVGDEALSLVQLYEAQLGRPRATVVQAAERELAQRLA